MIGLEYWLPRFGYLRLRRAHSGQVWGILFLGLLPQRGRPFHPKEAAESASLHLDHEILKASSYIEAHLEYFNLVLVCVGLRFEFHLNLAMRRKIILAQILFRDLIMVKSEDRFSRKLYLMWVKLECWMISNILMRKFLNQNGVHEKETVSGRVDEENAYVDHSIPRNNVPLSWSTVVIL